MIVSNLFIPDDPDMPCFFTNSTGSPFVNDLLQPSDENFPVGCCGEVLMVELGFVQFHVHDNDFKSRFR